MLAEKVEGGVRGFLPPFLMCWSVSTAATGMRAKSCGCGLDQLRQLDLGTVGSYGSVTLLAPFCCGELRFQPIVPGERHDLGLD